MAEPTTAELADSVIEAGLDWHYGISRTDTGQLDLNSRGSTPLDPPIEIRFTAEELRSYYQGIAADAERDPATQSPWQWWMTLMPTHLREAVYEMDKLAEPGVITITDSGFAAEPAARL